MAIVQFLVFTTLYSSLFAYAIFLYIIRTRQRLHRLDRPVGYRIPYTAKELPEYMFLKIRANLQASRDARIGPDIATCQQPGWGHPAGPLSDHHFKTEIIKSFKSLATAAVATDPHLVWENDMTAAEYVESLLGSSCRRGGKAAHPWDIDDGNSDEEDGEVAGMVIGQPSGLSENVAPYARALVSVYDLARFTPREFTQEEYTKYLSLLWTVVGCIQGKLLRLTESDMEWTLHLDPNNGPK